MFYEGFPIKWEDLNEFKKGKDYEAYFKFKDGKMTWGDYIYCRTTSTQEQNKKVKRIQCE